jgi:hypothetical protein
MGFITGFRETVYRLYIWFAGHLLLRRTMRRIGESGLFDEKAYLDCYPEVGQMGIPALVHYLLYGRYQGRYAGADLDLFFDMDHDPLSKPTWMVLWFRYLTGMEKVVRVRPFREVSGELDKRRESVTSALDSVQLEPEAIYQAYVSAEEGPDYEKEVHQNIPPNDIRLVAFYLTQFHPFAENDRFWGKGFTEWTNTTKARPLYKGHYQPRLPGELGFYDTRLKEVMLQQMNLAKKHGIHGFCLHHYFFDGKPLMRVPFEQIMQNPELDLPFCLHWANEPWTAKFDGYADRGGILMPQHHHPDDDILFFRDVEKALHDPRYICIDGKPVLIVYRPGLFPDFRKSVDRWRECANKSGLKGLYMIMVETIFEGLLNPAQYGVDAVVEFPPHYIRHIDAKPKLALFDPEFKGEIYSYPEVVAGELLREVPDYTLFRGIFPQWDNTARRKDPKIFHGAEPQLYQQWLSYLIDYTRQNLPDNKRFIFINAWNEWAEAAYLEPDRKYGYAYLNATSRALVNASRLV